MEERERSIQFKILSCEMSSPFNLFEIFSINFNKSFEFLSLCDPSRIHFVQFRQFHYICSLVFQWMSVRCMSSIRISCVLCVISAPRSISQWSIVCVCMCWTAFILKFSDVPAPILYKYKPFQRIWKMNTMTYFDWSDKRSNFSICHKSFIELYFFGRVINTKIHTILFSSELLLHMDYCSFVRSFIGACRCFSNKTTYIHKLLCRWHLIQIERVPFSFLF